ncbi:alginate O-acetyltransferase AlgX-related protein [Variovorax sp.]|uniref:alginate O-acetyltransferase AlgX-related protein n=1 Tax=Variovorax sp. TaxID=1871043 RepID=UPI003BA9CA62
MATARTNRRLRGLLRWTTAGVLIASLGAAFVAALPNMPGALARADASLLDDAAARRTLTKTLVTTPLTETLARYQREASWLLLGDLGAEVHRGEGDWLFLDEELRVHAGRVANARDRAATIADISRTLAARRIALLVVVVPDKSRIESAHLSRLRRPPELEGRVREWTAMLDAANVPVLDLAPVLAGAAPPPFLKTDTHWTEHGSQLAAQAVAERLRRMQVLDAAPVPSVVASRKAVTEWGDLVHLAGIDGLPPSLKPAPDTDWQSTVETRSESTDLFGNTALPSIVLIGSSFSRRANFRPFLQLAGQSLVADFAMDGGDFSGAARRYFSGPAFADNPPRAVVWEVPERALESPIAEPEREWMRRPLAPR